MMFGQFKTVVKKGLNHDHFNTHCLQPLHRNASGEQPMSCITCLCTASNLCPGFSFFCFERAFRAWGRFLQKQRILDSLSYLDLMT